MNKTSPKLLITLTILLAIGVAGVSGFLVFKNKQMPFTKKTAETSASVSETVTKIFDTNKTPPEITEESKTSDNLTDNLTQIAIEQIMANQEIDLSSLDNIDILFISPEISDKEIKIAENNNYFQDLTNIFNQTFSSSTFEKSDIEIANQALETQEYEELDEYILAYQIAFDQIKKLTVPYNFKNIHKEQLAIFDITKQILEAMRNHEEDPVKAIAGIAKYPEIEERAYEFALKLYEMQQDN